MRRLQEARADLAQGIAGRGARQTTAEGDDSWNFGEGAEIADRRVALENLGGGARHELYLAWDEWLGSRVVAKLLRPSLSNDAAALTTLRREAEVLASAAHPVVVRRLGAVLDGPRPHVVLEHVEGPSLARLVKRHGIVPLPRLVALGACLGDALAALAGRGFVHLDVSPSHVIAGATPRLVGLGCARRFGPGEFGGPVGADAYLAPELCGPAVPPSAIGPAADVFALGATLHHAARGTVPFPRRRGTHGSADPAIRFPQLHEDPAPLPSWLPSELRSLLLAMLSRDPSARPTASEVSTALAALRPRTAPQPTSAPPAPPDPE
jgi:eukaryotic-like serine/threonine-protein kinase